ncbi:MAG TPA: DNA polymerase IV [Ignavibacteriaceae bacterium]|jgi:DNA polymerase-4|nr:DNA polymerase IV [Ignavibacteriaceae bacterium]
MRIIFHLDLDAFFVSVERILDPSLNGKPVIVGGDPHGRGVVAACSYEARSYGLHSAMPVRQAFKLCPGGIYLHGHYDEYVHFSHAVKNVLSSYAPVIEQASIDEFYMDFTGCSKIYGSMFSFASKLQQEIRQKLSLPCSIGIGSNKTVAKIGSDCMKPMGITYIVPGMEREFLSYMPIETIPGVGKVTLRELNNKGFFLIRDITKLSVGYWGTAYGKYGIALWHKANGEGTEYLTVGHEQKSISKETTFGSDVTSDQKIYEVLFELTGKVCQNLRDENYIASTISIKLRYSDFSTLTRSRTLKPTDDDKVIFENARDLLRKAHTRRVGVRLIGVGVSKFSSFYEQEVLFEDEEVRRKKLFRAIDILRKKYSYSIINFSKY